MKTSPSSGKETHTRETRQEKLPNLIHERELYRTGICPVAGLDEAGRGAWAGPVVAAAVVLPAPDNGLESLLEGVRDSKLMTARQRSYWFEIIRENAVEYAAGLVSAAEIDQIGIVTATHKAMLQALLQLHDPPSHLLIDYLHLPVNIPQTSITHGDQYVLSIAAASILAKVTRDRIMEDLDREYPGYDLARSKGYGTRAHSSALSELGPCPEHRRSYRPVAQSLSSAQPTCRSAAQSLAVNKERG